MQFWKSRHAEGWHERDADATSHSLHSRRLHAVAMLVAVAALGASAGLNLIDDPRPLDVQLSAAMHKAGDTLSTWQGQLSRGLQVSLRAVADGRDKPGPVVALADPPAEAAVDADNRDQPVSINTATTRLPVAAH